MIVGQAFSNYNKSELHMFTASYFKVSFKVVSKRVKNQRKTFTNKLNGN